MASSRNNASPESLRASVAECLRHYLPSGLAQNLVVGFSGGRDSVALLHALAALQSEFGYQLAACHVNHQLSPYAAEWQLFCQRYCDGHAIQLEVVSVDVPRATADGLEAAAREKRYAAFSDLRADWLVLGQHRGDQAETMLFNLLRGTGLRGAAAIPVTRVIRPGLDVMRPLLNVSRKQIESYLHFHSLKWVEDESNLDVYFSRNFLRHQIIPLLQERFPAAEANLAAATGRFAEAMDLLDELAVHDLTGKPARFPIPISCIAGLSEPRGRNLLRFLLVQNGVRIPSESRLSEALRQLLSARVDRHPALVFGNWKIFRKRDSVHLAKILGA